MADQTKIIEKKSDLILKQLLEVDPSKIDLKFIFDHVRNYGIAATVMIAGFYLAKHPQESMTLLPSFDIFWAIFLMILGLVLSIFNLTQAIWIVAKLKLPMFLYFLFSFILFFGTTKLFWTYTKQVIAQFNF
ncbi:MULTISPECIES: hypothetical protein [Acinetobacter]|uniref:Uncharacterized protein n=2 Tax=Acinetobacter TaxID=469 RepID=A0A6I4HPT7_ACIBA|nr:MULTISPECIES: hypothetical protein [Acinetobacter]ENV51422.1 hypothetical protein F953_01180 [Acinetobacter junii CIP 107470 = MTCC 11364]EPR85886.1 putative membrane protein [Acinetobacter junii CIP 107470 = MTCC 11364]MBF6686933.1 hypothetical protein [Acinetobacter baumannii]MBF6716631.1 hypothetical protein [Acinetobacter baumannii]MBF6724443.1 hypothetical protein [Acinetobacter baumannii]